MSRSQLFALERIGADGFTTKAFGVAGANHFWRSVLDRDSEACRQVFRRLCLGDAEMFQLLRCFLRTLEDVVEAGHWWRRCNLHNYSLWSKRPTLNVLSAHVSTHIFPMCCPTSFPLRLSLVEAQLSFEFESPDVKAYVVIVHMLRWWEMCCDC